MCDVSKLHKGGLRQKMNRIPLRKRKTGKQPQTKRRRGTSFLEEKELAGGFLQCLPEGHQGLYVFTGTVESIDH